MMLSASVCLGANNSNWKPKYEKNKLKELKTKIKSTPTSQKTLSPKTESKVSYTPKTPLEAMYLKSSNSKTYISKLKAETMKLKQDAVPSLINVMKISAFPDENKWVATFMLGKIMGKKSADFISKFSAHPSWMMRLASLKVLLHLEQKQYVGIYARLLEDKSLIVRHQALQNIKEMNLKSLAPYVWKMLYNKENYVGQKGSRKRSNIIKDAIKVVGELELKEAVTPMLTMINRTKYQDVHAELDYSLSKIMKKDSPEGPMTIKRNYWKRVGLAQTKI